MPALTVLGTPPQPAPPLVAPDAGFEHDPNDPDEAELVATMQGRSGTERQNAINELRARKRGMAGSGAAVPPSSGPFKSDDPLVGDLANEIEAAKPGMVKGVNINLFKPDGTKATDIDIQVDGAAIQVKSGSGAGLTRQMNTTKQLTGLRTVAYGPGLGPTLQRSLRSLGFEV